MSTHIVDRIEAIRFPKETTGHYADLFLVAELGGDNNVRCARTNRRARTWSATAIGEDWAVIGEACRFAASCSGGMTKLHGRVTKPESYIRAYRKALTNAATMEEARRVKGLGLTARIRFTEEERKGWHYKELQKKGRTRARQPSTARPTRFSSLIFPRPKSWPFGLSIVTGTDGTMPKSMGRAKSKQLEQTAMSTAVNAESGIDVALRKGFHKMIANDMARECRAMLDACPTCEFDGLEAGKSYCYKPSYGTPALVVVGQTTPKRRQAVASVNQGAPRRIYKGDYYGSFIELDADLRALTGITHETVVKAAVDAGLDVPPIVRREYPGLFVEIPERFANGRFSAVERVTQALQPAPFQREPVSVADVDQFIEHAHYLLATARCERTRRAALNPDMGQDYDRMANDHIDDIDFYRWLRRQIDVGGVFHISVPAASHAA